MTLFKKVVFRDTAGNDHQLWQWNACHIRVALSRRGRRVSYVLDWHIALDILLRDVYKPVRKYWAWQLSECHSFSELFIKGGPTLDGVGEESVIRAENRPSFNNRKDSACSCKRQELGVTVKFGRETFKFMINSH